ncbi:MAG TPA: Rieske (2Fe-2S) protein [Rhodopila sp.]|jgi:nitrite reductase/ring-hydroxylating ferredoxin subunit|nr:Rieske (2Fe-2S) protein [Rhodopila sp.]
MLSADMAWTSLCDFDELEEGKGKYVEIGGFHLAIFLNVGKVYAIDNYCPHAGGNLSGGHVEAGCAVCPWHSWAFRLDNGELRDSPGVTISTYKIRLKDRGQDKPALIQADLPIF